MQKVGDFTSFLSVLLFGVKQGSVSLVYLSFLSYVRHLFCFSVCIGYRHWWYPRPGNRGQTASAARSLARWACGQLNTWAGEHKFPGPPLLYRMWQGKVYQLHAVITALEDLSGKEHALYFMMMSPSKAWELPKQWESAECMMWMWRIHHIHVNNEHLLGYDWTALSTQFTLCRTLRTVIFHTYWYFDKTCFFAIWMRVSLVGLLVWEWLVYMLTGIDSSLSILVIKLCS